MYASSDVPTVVVVGNYGVGKSSFVKALLGDKEGSQHSNNSNNSKKKSTKGKSQNDSQTSSELQMEASELIVESRIITIDNSEVQIIDTAARDVMGTQNQMSSADLVIVLINASKQKSISDLDEYWVDQFKDCALYSPVIACFNQIDKLSDQELIALKKKFETPTKEHFVLESIHYVSAYTGFGISEMKDLIIDTLRDVSECPRWVLIDPYSWKLCASFECALHRIFRLLDSDCDFVLNLQELEYFNVKILQEEFTPDSYNFLLRRLNEQNELFVKPQGLTYYGFRHLMKRFAIAKKWARCWDVLRYFHYQNDLTLHPRVMPQLPYIENRNNVSFELSECVFILLERLFALFADDTIMDDDDGGKSVASSMISGTLMQHMQHTGHNNNNNNNSNNSNDDDFMDDDDSEGRVLSMDGINEILSVLPEHRQELHCALPDGRVIDHFETAGRKLNKLTKNGWLTFWAMFAVENPENCFEQLTYLDLSTDTDRSSWFRVINRSNNDNTHRNKQMKLQKSVIRILLFGGSTCGKTVFCDRLLCRVPIERKANKMYNNYRSSQQSRRHKQTLNFRAVSNRIGASNEYHFLAITEVPAILQNIEQAMDKFLNAYDMILLMFDLSNSRSFYELNKIYDRMPKDHLLPIQVLASKSDLVHVSQYNQDCDDEKYEVETHLQSLGLSASAQTWLRGEESCDFPQLFDDLFFIATNPHYRRLKLNKNSDKKEEYSWKTIVKRTVTITVGVSFVIYGAYKIYKWFNSPNSSNTQNSHSKPMARRPYRRQ